MHLQDSPRNTPAVDFSCESCSSAFQLKSQSRPLTGCIAGSSYSKLMQEIHEDRTPNLFALHYQLLEWRVEKLILVPHFAFPISAIEKRKPLSPMAERKGWVGYNIRLNAIPIDARIDIISAGVPIPTRDARTRFERIRPLEKLKVKQRGWTLDVLNAVRSLGKREFSLRELYAREGDLERLHPNNSRVREKIRQQLQILRDDFGLVEFLGRGEYRLR
jgi:type II restriction enzyme